MSMAQNYSEEIVQGGDNLVLVPESVNLSALLAGNYTDKYAIAAERRGLNSQQGSGYARSAATPDLGESGR
jgi:hypothetical protein